MTVDLDNLRQEGWPDAADEIERLRRIIHTPFSPSEYRLIDKNCDWVAFGHAWNAVMKSRLASE